MFNVAPFNLMYFNQIFSVFSEVVEGQIVYGNYVLHEKDYIHVNYSNQWNAPRVEKTSFSIPNGPGIVQTSYEFRERTVTIRGTITKPTAAELIAEMEQMKKILCTPDQYLQVYITDEPWKAKASLMNPDEMFPREHYNITRQKFELVFEVTDPFWESLSVNNRTYGITGTLYEELLNVGTAETAPKVIVSFTTATSVTQVQFTM